MKTTIPSMARKYETIFSNDTIQLVKGKDGFWLYDLTRSMNLSMSALSEQQAFVDALMYYQNRLIEIEKEYKSLRGIVNNFVEQINCGQQ